MGTHGDPMAGLSRPGSLGLKLKMEIGFLGIQVEIGEV